MRTIATLRDGIATWRAREPHDDRAAFARTTTMLDEVGLLPLVQTVVGLLCAAIGLNAFVLGAFVEPPPPDPLPSLAVHAAIALPGVVWGARIVRRRRIGYVESVVLAAYCTATILGTAVGHPASGTSILRITWLIAISIYVFTFHSTYASLCQIGLVVIACAVVGARALLGGYPLVTVGSLVGTAIVVAAAAAALLESLKLRFRAQSTRLSATVGRDELTGLLNRRGLASACADRSDTVMVAVLDLDEFKPINDTHGHAVGDQVLIGTGRHLRSVVADGALIARLGGDEFAVVAQCVPTDLGERFAAATARDRFPVVASVGFAAGPADTLDELLHDADAAMYRAKRARHRRG